MEKGYSQKRIAYLEFVNDQLMSEILHVDDLLKHVGFPEGLETVKLAARELMNEKKNSKDKKEE